MDDMDATEAIDLINDAVTYRPGWELQAADFSNRHQGGILVKLEYKTYDYSQSFAPRYEDYSTVTVPFYFAMVPAHHETREDFLRALFEELQQVESHENREAFRVKNGDGEWEGVINPHTIDGQRNWGDIAHDVKFGDAGLAALDWYFD